jgi:hypothetical protein
MWLSENRILMAVDKYQAAVIEVGNSGEAVDVIKKNTRSKIPR